MLIGTHRTRPRPQMPFAIRSIHEREPRPYAQQEEPSSNDPNDNFSPETYFIWRPATTCIAHCVFTYGWQSSAVLVCRQVGDSQLAGNTASIEQSQEVSEMTFMYNIDPSKPYDGPEFEEYCISEGKYLPASRDRTPCMTCPLFSLCQPGFEEQVRRLQNGENPSLT